MNENEQRERFFCVKCQALVFHRLNNRSPVMWQCLGCGLLSLRETFCVYVLDGPDQGWHEFPTASELRAYCNLLRERKNDFVIEPRW